MTDPVLVGKRLGKLREYVRLLRALRERPRAEFVSDPFIYGCAERYLQLAIQVMLDIANHMVADERLGLVEEYRDAIRLLGENGYLSVELAQKLLPMAGLRNLLVRDYLEVDRNRLYDLLRDPLDDFEEFATHIARHLYIKESGAGRMPGLRRYIPIRINDLSLHALQSATIIVA